MRVLAEFRGSAGIESALDSLAAAGFERAQVDLYSSEPVELSDGVLDRPSRMSLFAVVGGMLSGLAATAGLMWTQMDYPLITGGMPITSGWATGVITFETTMGGAVAGTFLAFLIEGGFLKKRRQGPANALDSDTVFLELPCSEDDAERAAGLLREAGAAEVRCEEAP